MLAAYDPALYEGVCDGSIAYTDEKVVEVMNQWKDMLDKGYFSAPMTNVDMAKSVATGSVAMELEPNYEATTIVNDYGLDSKEDLGTFVLPSVDGAKKIVFYEIAPLCVSKHQQGQRRSYRSFEELVHQRKSDCLHRYHRFLMQQSGNS